MLGTLPASCQHGRPHQQLICSPHHLWILPTHIIAPPETSIIIEERTWKCSSSPSRKEQLAIEIQGSGSAVSNYRVGYVWETNHFAFLWLLRLVVNTQLNGTPIPWENCSWIAHISHYEASAFIQQKCSGCSWPCSVCHLCLSFVQYSAPENLSFDKLQFLHKHKEKGYTPSWFINTDGYWNVIDGSICKQERWCSYMCVQIQN